MINEPLEPSATMNRFFPIDVVRKTVICRHITDINAKHITSCIDSMAQIGVDLCAPLPKEVVDRMIESLGAASEDVFGVLHYTQLNTHELDTSWDFDQYIPANPPNDGDYFDMKMHILLNPTYSIPKLFVRYDENISDELVFFESAAERYVFALLRDAGVESVPCCMSRTHKDTIPNLLSYNSKNSRSATCSSIRDIIDANNEAVYIDHIHHLV